MSYSNKLVESALYGVCAVIGAIPKAYHLPVAEVLGRIWFLMDKRHRLITIDNIAKAYRLAPNHRDAEMLSRKVFSNLSRLILEACWAMGQRDETIKDYIDRSEFQHIKAALHKNKGALILTGHLGNWELLSFVFFLEGVKANAVYRPLDFAPMDHFVIGMRSKWGTNLIPATNALRKVVAALRKNEVVGLLVDQNSDPHYGVVIDFFGRPAFGTKGLALIARKTGAPVLPAFLVRENERLKFICGPEIPFTHTGDARKDIEINTQNYNQAIEKAVRQYPEQWLWLHRRWKSKVSSPWPREEMNGDIP